MVRPTPARNQKHIPRAPVGDIIEVSMQIRPDKCAQALALAVVLAWTGAASANTTPVARDQNVLTVKGQYRYFAAGYSDPDTGDSHTVTIVDQPDHGSASVHPAPAAERSMPGCRSQWPKRYSRSSSREAARAGTRTGRNREGAPGRPPATRAALPPPLRPSPHQDMR